MSLEHKLKENIEELLKIYEKKEGESPERILLSDTPLLATVVIWIVLVFVVIYGADILPTRFLHYIQ